MVFSVTAGLASCISAFLSSEFVSNFYLFSYFALFLPPPQSQQNNFDIYIFIQNTEQQDFFLLKTTMLRLV